MSRFQISRDSIEIRDLNARNVIRTRSWKRKRKAEPQEWHRSMQRELPGRVSRRFPDNRSHLCQVVEPQGFPPRLGDEVTIRYFLLLGRQRGSAVEARAHCQKREERKKRKKKKRKRRRSRRLERINRANRRERERRWKGGKWKEDGGRTKEVGEERRRRRRLKRGKRQVEEESITVLSIPGAWQSSFQGSRTPLTGPNSKVVAPVSYERRPRRFHKWHNYRAVIADVTSVFIAAPHRPRF